MPCSRYSGNELTNIQNKRKNKPYSSSVNLSVENLIRFYTLSVEKVVIFCKVRLANDRRVCRANRLDCFHYADM